MQVATPLFYIGFKDNELNLTGEELIKKDIVTNMVLDMMFSPSSKFYNELYYEGLIDNSFGAYYTGKKTYGHSLVVGQSATPEIVQDRIVKLINSSSEQNLLEEDFIRLKRKNLGNFLMGFNSVEFIANNFVDLYFDDFNLLDYLDVLESISFSDLLKRYESHFKPENMVISIIRPA
jgi:predicted Zn-dependent peptidase